MPTILSSLDQAEPESPAQRAPCGGQEAGVEGGGDALAGEEDVIAQ